MKILVCIKEVPDLDPESELLLDSDSGWMKTDDHLGFMINRFDEFAVEEAILLKENHPETTIDVLTVGPDHSHQVLRRAMGMGADHGIHIVTDSYGYICPSQISDWIASVTRDRGYDLIFTGVMAEDTLHGQTGVMLAQHLSIPWASSVIQKKLSEDLKSIEVVREIEGGQRDLLQIPLPCLLTIQTGVNQPRYPILSKMLKAKKAALETIPISSLPNQVEAQIINQTDYPQKSRDGKVLEGTQQEKASQLIKILQEKSLLH